MALNQSVSERGADRWHFRRIPWQRLTRFALVGIACGGFQLVLLAVFVEATPLGRSGNLVAFVLSAQMNYVLSERLTWSDRRGSHGFGWRRLAGFNALIIAAAGINQVLFIAVDMLAPYLAASALALIATSVLKYAIADRRVFPARV
ncbi:MAG: GtrA family protein [Dehalococcoidia bacterium]|nr:GtrA family protein [Dehalococcoidia bacterium]MCB9486054.1 GtrA family protein [Thermoflexaceae bacterium]